MKIRLLTACFLTFLYNACAQDSIAMPRKGQPLMTVRVFNYAGLSRGQMNLAESVVSGIFRQSGVQVLWRDCGPSSEADADPNCRDGAGLTTLSVRICDSCTSLLRSAEHEVRGFATGRIATVSTSWAEELPQTLYVSSEEILGRVLAHELGHLLLGPSHSPVGIMKAHWVADDLEAKTLGVLTFTSRQARQIRSILKSQEAVKGEAIHAVAKTRTSGGTVGD